MASTILRTRTIQTVGALTLTSASIYSLYTFSPRFADAFSVHAESASPSQSFKNQWVELPLHSSESISPNVKRLKFSLPTPETTPELSRTITTLWTKFKREGDWLETKRRYTPISISSDAGFVELLVKKYERGTASTYMHDLQPGDKMSFMKAYGPVDWKYTPGKYMSILCIAGGTGITPMWQLIRQVLSTERDRTTLSLIYANETEEDILLKDEIDAMAAKYPSRFRVMYTVTEGAKTQGIETGYVNKEMIERFLPKIRDGQDFMEKRFGDERFKVLVWGPKRMVMALAGFKTPFEMQGNLGGVLRDMGLAKFEVRKF